MRVSPTVKVTTRKATIQDVREIHSLINRYARRRLLLPRSLSYIYDNVRDFYVCVNRRKQVVACCALHVAWDDLAEIKSLVVRKKYQGKHLGTVLVNQCLTEAKELGIKRVFALTYEADFFRKNKFTFINKTRLPAKVWRECVECHLFPDCDEIALIKKL